jgi:hypothetical protein
MEIKKIVIILGFTLLSCNYNFWEVAESEDCNPKNTLEGEHKKRWLEFNNRDAKLKSCLKISITSIINPNSVIYSNVTPVITRVNGEIHENKTSDQRVTFFLPDLKIEKSKQTDYYILFRLYVLNEEYKEDDTPHHTTLCEETHPSQYHCTTSNCLFYLKFSPKIPDHLKYKKESLPTKCVLIQNENTSPENIPEEATIRDENTSPENIPEEATIRDENTSPENIPEETPDK